MRHATQLLQLIEQTMMADQGAKFRHHLGQCVRGLTDAFSSKEEAHRTHLGASIIGRECTREVWYTFRWATVKRHTGRLLRLFNRGHLEEARFLALLEMVGVTTTVYNADGQQFKITDESGHFGGSLDSVLYGVPDLPGLHILGEFKTHGDKSFTKLVEFGVHGSKWEHYVQVQMYMGRTKLPTALYFAVNKNTDDLWAELVPFDQGTYDRYTQRAAEVIIAPAPPRRINESASWYTCKMCDHLQVCHKRVAPDRTCRSCQHVTPVWGGGGWYCTAKSESRTTEQQLKACINYRLLEAF